MIRPLLTFLSILLVYSWFATKNVLAIGLSSTEHLRITGVADILALGGLKTFGANLLESTTQDTSVKRPSIIIRAMVPLHASGFLKKSTLTQSSRVFAGELLYQINRHINVGVCGQLVLDNAELIHFRNLDSEVLITLQGYRANVLLVGELKVLAYKRFSLGLRAGGGLCFRRWTRQGFGVRSIPTFGDSTNMTKSLFGAFQLQDDTNKPLVCMGLTSQFRIYRSLALIGQVTLNYTLTLITTLKSISIANNTQQSDRVWESRPAMWSANIGLAWQFSLPKE